MSEQAEQGQVVDARTFWRAIGVRAIGASVVTGADSDGPAGFLALSATHLCADPPLMMVSIGIGTSALKQVTNSRHFAINYLAKGQEAMAEMFGGRGDAKGADRFEPGRWGALKTGAPVLLDAAGALDCRLEEIIERPGVVIAIGRLIDFTSAPDRKPLISYRGGYI